MNLYTALKNTEQVYPRLAREEIEYIRSHKEEAVPFLLERLKDAAAPDFGGDIAYTIFLLAEFRERGALPSLLKILEFDEDNVDYILGDILTDDYPAILASCAAADDIPAIKTAALNVKADEFSRLAAADALTLMYAEGVMPREELVALYDEIMAKHTDCNALITFTISYCADLHIDELERKARVLVEKGMLDDLETPERWEEDFLKYTRESALAKYKEDMHNKYITDTIKSMECWVVFKEGTDYDFGRKIGPNEPCPCGSGKKFKKCCRLRLK